EPRIGPGGRRVGPRRRTDEVRVAVLAHARVRGADSQATVEPVVEAPLPLAGLGEHGVVGLRLTEVPELAEASCETLVQELHEVRAVLRGLLVRGRRFRPEVELGPPQAPDVLNPRDGRPLEPRGQGPLDVPVRFRPGEDSHELLLRERRVLDLLAVHDLERERVELAPDVPHAELVEVALVDEVLPEAPEGRDVPVPRVRLPSVVLVLEDREAAFDVAVRDVAKVGLAYPVEDLPDPRLVGLARLRGAV